MDIKQTCSTTISFPYNGSTIYFKTEKTQKEVYTLIDTIRHELSASRIKFSYLYDKNYEDKVYEASKERYLTLLGLLGLNSCHSEHILKRIIYEIYK